MKKLLLKNTGIILSLLLLVACGGGNGDDERGTSYTIEGTLWQDSLSADTILYLLANHHTAGVEQVELSVVDGTFAWQYQSDSTLEMVDELILSTPRRGCLAHLYVGNGDQLHVEVDSLGKTVCSDRDSLNIWLQETVNLCENMHVTQARKYVDSICSNEGNLLRSSLLLREATYLVNDSLFVRRNLGHLSEEVKPAWIISAIEEQLDQRWQEMKRGSRIPAFEVQYGDSAETYQHMQGAIESLVLYFWADYDSASIDSLHLFKDISRDFGLYTDGKGFYNEKSKTKRSKPRRIELVSLCLHAQDSAAWRETVKDLPGKHVWLQAGFADPVAQYCYLKELPTLIFFDRYSDCRGLNVWGEDLYKVLESAVINSEIANYRPESQRRNAESKRDRKK